MKCSVCVKTGKKSQVYPGMITCTAAGFPTYYDEDGVYHSHDGNVCTQTFGCSNGHHGTRKFQNLCPAPQCPWNEKRTVIEEWS